MIAGLAAADQQVLRTGRTVLIPLVPNHAEALARLEADADVMRYITGRPRNAVESRRHMTSRYLDRYAGLPIGAWAVLAEPTGEHMGLALLKQLDGADEIEVGFSFFPKFWGRGYATEVAGRLLDHGFRDLGLASIAAVVHPDNIGSRRVLETYGLRPAGKINTGDGVDLDCYRISRSAWQKRTAIET